MLSLRSIFSRQSHSLQRERMLRKLSMTVSIFGALLWANAQTRPAASAEKVYTYVEQMPQLPGGGGMPQIMAAIAKRMRLSGKIEPSCYRTMVYFEVSPAGVVRHAKVTTASQSPAVDAALLRAVRSLPTLRPGYQQGKPVTVSFTMPFRTATQ
jgi:protein TonB